MKADILGAAYIVAVSLLGIFVWRTIGGLAAGNPNTAAIGKAMLSISA
jgi:hypothetical protein